MATPVVATDECNPHLFSKMSTLVSAHSASLPTRWRDPRFTPRRRFGGLIGVREHFLARRHSMSVPLMLRHHAGSHRITS
jgi:hypothetical protein